MRLKPSMGRLFFIAATAGLVIGLTAGQAAAATTWTITPGGQFSGSAGKTTLKAGSSAVLTCKSSTIIGTLNSGSKQTDPIGKIDGIGFDNCSVGADFTRAAFIDRLPWAINAHSYNTVTGISSGTISGVQIVLSSPTCTATLGGTSPAMSLTANFSYTNSSGILKITAPSGAHWWDVSGCLSLIRNGEPGSFSFGNGFVITPAQKITSP